jgi:hypothetical protein
MDKRVLILNSYTLTSRPLETNRFNKAGDEELLDYLASQLTREPGPFALSSYVPASGLHLIAANLPAETRVLETPSIEEFRESLKSTIEVHNVLQDCADRYNLEPLSSQ